MKKIALTIALLAVVIGGLVGGMVVAAPAGPTITVSPGKVVPGDTLTVKGSGWSPDDMVYVYMDEVDLTHQLVFSQTQPNGKFEASFIMAATTMGLHEVVAVQGAKQVSYTVVLTATTPIDERIATMLADLQSQIATLKGRLTEARANNLDLLPDMDTQLGEMEMALANIQADLSGVDTVVDATHYLALQSSLALGNPNYGLQAIQDDFGTVEVRMEAIQNSINEALALLGNADSRLGAIQNDFNSVDTKLDALYELLLQTSLNLGNPDFGLGAIQNDFNTLQSRVDSIASDVADIKSDSANVVRMESLGGFKTYTDFRGEVISQDYGDQIRHVVLQVWYSGVDLEAEDWWDGDYLTVEADWTPVGISYYQFVAKAGRDSWYGQAYLEFNASSWSISVHEAGGPLSVQLEYSATVTYSEVPAVIDGTP